MTLMDALNLAYGLRQHRVMDKDRLQRGYDIAASALRGISGSYDVDAFGTSFTERAACYRVDKYDKGGKLEVSYFINVMQALACTCPDVQKNGVINCKHVYACELWQQAKHLFADYTRNSLGKYQ
jgi:hypothetical protein